MSRLRSVAFGWIVAAYVAALAAAVATLFAVDALPSWALSEFLDTALGRGAAMDAVATLVVFAFSIRFRNSSFYDAYWSIAPIALAAYWAFTGQFHMARGALVGALVFWWGVRLTWNWARGWTGLDHEDWRYVDLRNQSGVFWPAVNLLGIHVFPTVQVFLGLLPVHAALSIDAPLGVWDGVGVVITAVAILIEQVSDRQLLRYREGRARGEGGAVLNTGLWAYSRHPNYVGEALFWWGLGFFGLSTVPNETWRWSGAVAITVMFVVVSIPLIEKRHRTRRPTYEKEAARGVFFPLPPRR